MTAMLRLQYFSSYKNFIALKINLKINNKKIKVIY